MIKGDAVVRFYFLVNIYIYNFKDINVKLFFSFRSFEYPNKKFYFNDLK